MCVFGSEFAPPDTSSGITGPPSVERERESAGRAGFGFLVRHHMAAPGIIGHNRASVELPALVTSSASPASFALFALLALLVLCVLPPPAAWLVLCVGAIVRVRVVMNAESHRWWHRATIGVIPRVRIVLNSGIAPVVASSNQWCDSSCWC